MNTHLQKHLFSFSFPLSFSLKFLPALMCTFSGCSTGLPWYSFPSLHIHVHYFNWIWRSLKSQRKRLPFFYRCCRFAVFLLHYSRLPDSLLVSHSDSIGDVRRGGLGGQRDRLWVNILAINTYISHFLRWLSLNRRQALSQGRMDMIKAQIRTA